MSNIFIREVDGSGIYDIPENDVQLAAATAGLDALIGTIPGLSYGRILAWVEDSGGPGGAEGTRTLNCFIQTFTYGGLECPPEQGVGSIDVLVGLVESTLQADPNISTIGAQQYSLYETVSSEGVDRRAPAIIVGNTVQGDTLDVCDYLDIGDGTELAAAIAAAAASGSIGAKDVWIRPGIYNFDQATSPTSAIVIPSNVTVRGSGWGVVSILGRTDFDLCLFHLSDNAELWDVYIEQQPPDPEGVISSSYLGVVDSSDSTLTACRRVEVNMPGTYTVDQANALDLYGAFNYVGTGVSVDNISYEECVATGPSFSVIGGKTVFTGFFFGVTEKEWQSESHYEKCSAHGFDVSYGGMPDLSSDPLFCGYMHLRECLSDSPFFAGSLFYDTFVGGGYVEVERCRFVTSDGVFIGFSGTVVTNCIIQCNEGVNGIAASKIASHNTVTGFGEAIVGSLFDSYSEYSVCDNYVDGDIVIDDGTACGNVLVSGSSISVVDDSTVTGNRLSGGDISVGSGDDNVISGNILDSGDISISSGGQLNLVVGNRVKNGNIDVAGNNNKIAHNLLVVGSVNDTGVGNNLSGNI